jgi:hypothetical protein
MGDRIPGSRILLTFISNVNVIGTVLHILTDKGRLTCSKIGIYWERKVYTDVAENYATSNLTYLGKRRDRKAHLSGFLR